MQTREEVVKILRSSYLEAPKVTFRSRSATICAAYLIQEMNMDAEEAVETIREDGGDFVNPAWHRREAGRCA